jgi:hypothetical protein
MPDACGLSGVLVIRAVGTFAAERDNGHLGGHHKA